MSSPLRLLFVCTGNICRSPTAEGVFQNLCAQSGLQDYITVDSAGVAAYHIGEPPDKRTVAVAAEQGVDLSHLRARQITVDDFTAFDYIFAMDRGHYAALVQMQQKSGQNTPQHAHVGLFGDPQFTVKGIDSLEITEIPDPYYGTRKDFVNVFFMIEAISRDILQAIQARNLSLLS
jgi:protein-tyrosine phosphatase